MDELLSIGEFSARCGLSVKRLRSYAAAGLLPPAAVDASSGYRYYSVRQLHAAGLVALLRRAGIGVDEIACFLADPDPARFERWDQEIVTSSASRRTALAEAQAAVELRRPPTHLDAPPKGREMKLTLEAGAATHVGGRQSNQDAVLTGDRIFAVADGLGGLEHGEVASRLALDTLDAAFASDATLAGLLGACRAANDAVWRQARATDDADSPTMGTTLAAVGVTSDIDAVVVSVGDSRLYRMRKGRLGQLTDDHTVVADLVRDGEITEAEALEHPHRHVLTRALGVSPAVEVDFAGVSCEPGDRLLLCTDGLFQALSGRELKAILSQESEPPQVVADRLVAASVGHGAEDNVTVLVLDVA